MKKYLIHTSVNYSVVIEADSEKEAKSIVEDLDFDSWDTEDCSPLDIEEVYENREGISL